MIGFDPNGENQLLRRGSLLIDSMVAMTDKFAKVSGVVMRLFAKSCVTRPGRIAAFAGLFAAAVLAAMPIPPVDAGFVITGFSKTFAPDIIGPGSTTTLTFTIDNSLQGLPAEDLAFTDTLPAGVTIATPASASTTCRVSLSVEFLAIARKCRCRDGRKVNRIRPGMVLCEGAQNRGAPLRREIFCQIHATPAIDVLHHQCGRIRRIFFDPGMAVLNPQGADDDTVGIRPGFVGQAALAAIGDLKGAERHLGPATPEVFFFCVIWQKR